MTISAEQLDFYLEIILFIGLFQGLFLAATLIRMGKKTNPSNYFLAGIVLLFCIILAHQFLVETRWILDNLYFFFLSLSTPLLIGPFLYFYTAFLLQKNTKLRKLDGLHFLPFLLVLSYFLINYALNGNPSGVRFALASIPLQITITGVLKVFHMLIYSVITLRFLNRHKAELSKRRKNQAVILRWLKVFLVAFLITWLIGSMTFLLGHFKIPYANLLDDLPIIPLVLLLYIVAYMAIRHPMIVTSNTKPYEGSRLTQSKKEQIIASIETAMKEEALYKKSDLKLADLADRLGVSAHEVSQVINEQLALSFQEYMNARRVEEVQRKLSLPEEEHKTFLAIALEAGFNSKAVFNRAFKKFTGMTPLEYKRAIQQK